MKKLSVLLLVLFFAFISKAQPVTYTVNQIPYAPDPYSGGTNLGLYYDDIYSDKIPIGFTFSFFGINYDSIVVSSNGSISFNLGVANSSCGWATNGLTIPSGNQYGNLVNSILSPMQDLNPDTNSNVYSIRANLLGVAPYRRLVISYDSVSLFSCNTIVFSNQVILYETTNEIDINIKDKLLCPGWNGGVAILGIQNIWGTLAYSPPNRNGDVQWTATQESWRFIPSNSGISIPTSCKIKGNIFFDENLNCTKDLLEYGNMNCFVLTDEGNYYAYTDNLGNYEMTVDTGTYVITHYPLGSVSVLCPISNAYTVTLPAYGDSIENINFADSAAICSDLTTSIGVTNLRNCYNNLVHVSTSNLGSIPATNPILTITAPSIATLNDFNIPPTSQSGNVYTFDFSTIGLTLFPGQTIGFSFKAMLNCDMANLGTTQCFTSAVSSSNFDCDTNNNAYNPCYTVVSSYDPNQIQAITSRQPAFVYTGDFFSSDWITYKIDFQNTGTASAIDIRINDVLDASLLELKTVQLIGSSHSPFLVRKDEVLDFYFKNINLPDSNANEELSHGWVTFKVKTKTGLPYGTNLNNVVDIYFDNNPAVATNICALTIPIPKNELPESEIKLEISPNPLTETSVIKLNDGILNGSIEIFNILGQQVFFQNVQSNTLQISKKQLSAGIYTIIYHPLNKKILSSKLSIQ